MSKPIRIGENLVEQGVLSEQQVFEILQAQREQHLPFGVLAERMFEVTVESIENAWVEQYYRYTGPIDLDQHHVDAEALRLINRRQAWQFRILPLRFEGRELLIATTQQHLRRALRFATNVIGIPVFFVMARPKALGQALCKRYPLPGMTPELVDEDVIETGKDSTRHVAA